MIRQHGLVNETAPHSRRGRLPRSDSTGQYRRAGPLTFAARAASRARRGRPTCALPSTASPAGGHRSRAAAAASPAAARNPVPPPDHQRGPRRFGPQPELPQRALDAQQRAGTQAVEQLRREPAGRRAPHMQLEQPAVGRRARDREAATAALRQHDVEVLARPEMQLLDGGQSQEQLPSRPSAMRSLRSMRHGRLFTSTSGAGRISRASTVQVRQCARLAEQAPGPGRPPPP